MFEPSNDSLLDKMVQAVEIVRHRLLCATDALEKASIPYAVAGDHAIAAWVGKVDPSAVRNSPHIEILLRRANLNAAANAFRANGFLQRDIKGAVMFVEEIRTKVRDAVHIVFAGETVRENSLTALPDVTDSEKLDQFRVVSLVALVRMKLSSFRSEDNLNLRDLLEVGLIDPTWRTRFSGELATRLQQIIDTPEE